MRALDLKAIATGALTGLPLLASAQTTAHPPSFEKLAAQCAPDVHPTTLKGLVSTESSWNPYAIGVVGGRLDHQPRTLAEAVATARDLDRQGFNFSMGLGQVNRYNLPKYGETYDTVFEPCRNLKAGSAILKDCYLRAHAQMGDEQQALRAAFSCYYSGNFTQGFRQDWTGQPSYVQKVVANATGTARPIPVVPAVQPRGADRVVPVRPATRSAGTAKAAGAPTQWVTFADWSRGSGAAALPEQAPQGEAQAVSEKRPAPRIGRQNASFVQFVN